MNIVVDGQERYVTANLGKIRRAQRHVFVEVCRVYRNDLEEADFLGGIYLRCKRWLELRHKLNELQQYLDRNLYLQTN